MATRMTDGEQKIPLLEFRTNTATTASAGNDKPLGVGDGSISDEQISASSEKETRAAIQGRLNSGGDWTALVNDVNQWLQIDLRNHHTRVTKIATQGGNAVSNWVIKYKLQYSDDGVIFKYYRKEGYCKDKVFYGNKDVSTVVEHYLTQPIRSRYIRFRPLAWHKGISMRVELYGFVEQGANEKREFEDTLMDKVDNGDFEEIEESLTPQAFRKCESNSLHMGMKVNFKLRKLAERMGPDKERFEQLANSVEEFTNGLLDSLRSEKNWRRQFGDLILDDVVNVAIENEQRKFFTHPVVHEEMDRKWNGRHFSKRKWKWWQKTFFHIWCFFDLMLFSVILYPLSYWKERKEEKRKAVARIEKAPKSQIVQVGDSVEFKCKISGNLSPRTSWYKDGNELREREDKLNIMTVPITTQKENEGNGLEEKGCILKITNAQIEDEGEYTCIVQNEFEEQQCTATLTVEGVAKIEKAPKSQIVHVGDSVEFKCETSGKASILTTWLKDGNELKKEGCTFKIPNAKLQDQGEYTCIVRNEYGEHKCIVALTVKEVREDTDNNNIAEAEENETDNAVARIVKAPKSQIVHVGDSVEFKCETSGKPRILTTWYKDGNKLEKEGCTLKIPNAQIGDEGKYTCIVKNEFGEHKCIVTLTVEEAATIVTEEGPQKADVGDSVKFKCNISGNPTPSTIWYKDGEKLNSSIEKRILIKTERDSSQLEIESAQLSDKGRYTCVVKNDLGEDKRSFYLAVVKAVAKIKKPLKSQKVKVGESVEFACEISGNPRPQMTWYKDGSKREENGCTLKITNAKMEDQGLYSCIATNDLGEHKCSAKLIVAGEEEINEGNVAAKIGKEEGPQKACVGHSVKFECKISGNPTPSTIWYKDGEKLNSSIKKRILIKTERDSSQLEIENAQISDQGCYTCVVKNESGEHRRSFRLTVVKDPAYVMYLAYMKTPYYKFARDTLSYLLLVGLHFFLCLEPTTREMSILEWIIFIFFIGRYLVERKQIRQQKSTYFSDCWNKLDLISLLVYLLIFLLRTGALAMPGSSVASKWVLAFIGYLYGLNTLFLTIRTCCFLIEQSKTVGIIQIAFFEILEDVSVVFVQFAAVLVAFSIALTKIFMTDIFLHPREAEEGTHAWWTMFKHLVWSILGQNDVFDRMEFKDLMSVILELLLIACFLVIGVILLMNMLIALLTHTYDRTQENAFMKWSFQRAINIETYATYDPIPVPLNIIYNAGELLRCLVQRCKDTIPKTRQIGKDHHLFFKHLEDKYFEKHANLFPVTDPVLQEAERNRQITSQIIRTTFPHQGHCGGPEEWESHPSVRIEGPLLTCEGCTETDSRQFPGARCRKPFSAESPYFEVVVLETGKKEQFGIGVVNDGYNTSRMPGWYANSLGYHTNDGQIFHNSDGRVTKGIVLARRGDLIRCTRIREDLDTGKVYFRFTLNGRKITLEDEEVEIFTLANSKGPLHPYVAMAEGCSILARML